MPKVSFVTEKKEIEVPQGANLRQEAIKAGIELYSGPHRYLNCRGFGLCGSCRVVIKSGGESLSPKSFIEKVTFNTNPEAILAAIGHENDMRLACQCKVNGDCAIVTRPAINLYGDNFWQRPYPNK